MKILEPIFIEVIEKLIHNNVDFIVIGGYAVNYHGYGRYTGDIDFWLRPSEENKIRFLKVFKEICSSNDDLKKIESKNFEEAQVISIGEPPIQMDFLTGVSLVNFEEAWGKKVYFTLKNWQVPVVDYEHLIIMKFNTGRPKDKLDLEQLQKINLRKRSS